MDSEPIPAQGRYVLGSDDHELTRLDRQDAGAEWVKQAFSAAGASPMIGARLGPILTQAGLDNVKTFGVQAYIPPRDPTGAALLAGVVRSLAGEITRRGIATAEELDIDTLERRIADEILRNDAVLLPPTVVGAWGRRVGADAAVIS